MIKTKIEWTNIIPNSYGATWNPIRANNLKTNKRGWACIKNSAGCLNCYAESLNLRYGTGLFYRASELGKYSIEMSMRGQTSLDWPFRVKQSIGIFPCSMTDWLGEFVAQSWSLDILGVMMLARQHIFMPLTKRPQRLADLLTKLSVQGVIGFHIRKEFDKFIEKLPVVIPKPEEEYIYIYSEGNKGGIKALWPPRNILFGVTICTQEEAKKALPILKKLKEFVSNIRLWVSEEPALEEINWIELGYPSNLFDWLVWGGETGKGARTASAESLQYAIKYCSVNNTPLFIKKFGKGFLDSLGLASEESAQIDFPQQEFPNIENCYIHQKGK